MGGGYEDTDGHFGALVRLLILTGMRRGRYAAMQAHGFLASRSAPKEATKNGREHISNERSGHLDSY